MNDEQKMAKAVLRDGAISHKTSIMIANTIRGMMTAKAQALLERVAKKQEPIKFTRFRDGAGHRSGFGAAKYPIKAADAFLALIKQGVANAENKALGTPLKIASVITNQASRPMHQGSARGNAMKRTHVEIIMVETDESKKRERKAKKADKPKSQSKSTETPKTESKQASEPKDSPKSPSTEEKSEPKTESKVDSKETSKSSKEESKPVEKESPKESKPKEQPKAKEAQ